MGPLGDTWMLLEPHPLLHMYINKLEKGNRTVCSTWLHLTDSEVKCLLFADDLVLLSPTKEGLQQHLDLLHRLSDLGPDSKSQ